MDWLSMERWSPYAVGIGIGILSWITFLLSDKPIGCSTAFSRRGHFGEITWPELLKINPWGMIIPVTVGVILLLFWIETSGL
jgi:hypothetical protein